MSLYKRGRTYWTQFYMDGVRHLESTGSTNKRQAEAIEQKFKEEAIAKKFQLAEVSEDLTFAALAARFLASGSSRPHHHYHLKFLLPFFGETVACRITKPMTAEYRKARRQVNPAIKGASVNRDLSCLRHILYWAVDEHLLSANPAARMKMERERRTRRQVLSLEEEFLLIPAASEHLQSMIVCALDTGMRRGEITGQRWEDVDVGRRLLFVTKSKTPEGEAREIPLTARLFDLLVKARRKDGFVFQYKDEPVVIIKRSWKTALRNAGLRHIRFHDLRHTFATRLMEAGVLQEVRMALMGHSSGKSVHGTYVHIELPAKRQAIQRLEAWVKQQQTQCEKPKEDSHADS